MALRESFFRSETGLTKRVLASSPLHHSMPGLPVVSAAPRPGRTTSLAPVVAALNTLLCPGVIVMSLAACAVLFGETFTGHYLALAVLAFLIAAQVFDHIDLFHPWRRGELGHVSRSVMASWGALVGIVLFLGYATRLNEQFSYEVILAWFAVTPALLLVSINVARGIVRRVIVEGSIAHSAIIVGASNVGRIFAERLSADPYVNVRLHGFFDDRIPTRIGNFGVSLLGTVGEAADYVRRQGIHAVYVTLPIAAQPRILQLFDELRDTTASVYFVPDFSMFDLMQARFNNISGTPVIAIRDTPFYGVNAVVKRAMDLVLGALIVVLMAPVMLVIAAAVKLDSPGPVLFRQRRYGIDGEEIVVRKFRTMKVCEDGDRIVQARQGDARVTNLGRFLRRTSLDELPQFFNVLEGSMSIVGPRPHAVAHNEQYRKLIPGYMLRHKVKPGITGWAQINGFRGETETVEQMKRRVDRDLEYLNNWSPSTDLLIIVRTITHAWNDRNAY